MNDIIESKAHLFPPVAASSFGLNFEHFSFGLLNYFNIISRKAEWGKTPHDTQEAQHWWDSATAQCGCMKFQRVPVHKAWEYGSV